MQTMNLLAAGVVLALAISPPLNLASAAELSTQEQSIARNFEAAAADPSAHAYMLNASDPNFFLRTQKLQKVWGSAEVLDGQTLKIGARTIKLFGVTAPPESVVCKSAGGMPFHAGRYSMERLKAKAPSAKAVICYLESETDNKGTCFVWGFPGPINIGRMLVREGAAWANETESHLYVREEGWAEGYSVNSKVDNLWTSDCRSAR